MKTIARACMCCGGITGQKFPLGHWDVAGVGELELAIRVCDGCGAVLQDPAPNPATMALYYKHYSNYTNSSRSGRPDQLAIDTATRQITLIQKYLSPQRAFEVGCATGYCLSELKKIGWAVNGCDPSPTAAKVAWEQWGISIHVGLLAEIKTDSECTDLVIFSHVLEHLYEPIAALKQAYEMLSPGGHLLVEVPCLPTSGSLTNGYFTFEHLNIFSKETLPPCLGMAGFAVCSSNITRDHAQYPVITILAKKTNNNATKLHSVNDYSKVVQFVSEHLRSETVDWERIDRLLRTELIKYDRVAVWGGGIHTTQLLARTSALATKKITMILDSDPQKQGLLLRGARIQSPNTAQIDAQVPIVISSKASEEEIFHSVKNRTTMNAPVIRLYNFT